MTEFEYVNVSLGEEEYGFTLGDATGNGNLTVLAVTNYEDGMHYVSDEIAACSNELLPTATLPDRAGMPRDYDFEHGVSVRKMDDIANAIHNKDKLEIENQISRLEEAKSDSGPYIDGLLEEEDLDSAHNSSQNKSSSVKARRKMDILDHKRSPDDFL